MTGRKQSDKTRNSDTTETRTSSDCSGQYSYLIHFQIASFTKVVRKICLVTEMLNWTQRLKNKWVQIEISCLQPGKPGNFLPLGSFPFQYSSERATNLDMSQEEDVENEMPLGENKIILKYDASQTNDKGIYSKLICRQFLYMYLILNFL